MNILMYCGLQVNSASLSASALGTLRPSPSASTSTPPLRRRDGFEYFDPAFGPDARVSADTKDIDMHEF